MNCVYPIETSSSIKAYLLVSWSIDLNIYLICYHQYDCSLGIIIWTVKLIVEIEMTADAVNDCKCNALMKNREEERLRRKRCPPYKRAVTLSDQWASTSAALTNCSLTHVRPHPLLLVLSPHHSYISNKIYHQHLVNRQPVDDVYCCRIARTTYQLFKLKLTVRVTIQSLNNYLQESYIPIWSASGSLRILTNFTPWQPSYARFLFAIYWPMPFQRLKFKVIVLYYQLSGTFIHCHWLRLLTASTIELGPVKYLLVELRISAIEH